MLRPAPASSQGAMNTSRFAVIARLRRSDAWLAAAFFAAVVRAVLPQGLALASQEGRPALQICTAYGLQTLGGEEGGAATVLAAGLCHVTHSPGCGTADAPALHVSAIEWSVRPVIHAAMRWTPARPFRPQAARAPPSASVLKRPMAGRALQA